MSEYTRDEIAQWVDQEGGVLDAIVGYGIHSGVLPEDTPDDIVDAWKRIEGIEPDLRTIQGWLW